MKIGAYKERRVRNVRKGFPEASFFFIDLSVEACLVVLQQALEVLEHVCTAVEKRQVLRRVQPRKGRVEVRHVGFCLLVVAKE